MPKPIFVFIALLFSGFVYSQESVNTAGGDLTGDNGSVSYSIGQVTYSSNNGTNGSLSEGVQQAYSITNVYTNSFPKAPEITCRVYPNPTEAVLQISIDAENIINYRYSLYNIEGRLIDQDVIHSSLSSILMDDLNSSTYLLEISRDGIPINTFQIIKK